MTSVTQRFKEALRGKSTPEGEWKSRCKRYQNLDKKNNPNTDSLYRKRDAGYAQEGGLESLREIVNLHGPEITQSLVSALEGHGLALSTQVYILRLCQTENPNHAINFLQALPEAPAEELRQPLALQWSYYQGALESVLSQKEGEETFGQFLRKVDEIYPQAERGSRWTNTWINILELSFKHGLPLMHDALSYIPPSQISPLNFEERLRVEREIAETKENPVEREYLCSPGLDKSIQGVSFRGHCTSIAVIWDVARGYARNNRDGTVTTLLQGDSRRIDGFRETLIQQEKDCYQNDLEMVLQRDIPFAQAEEIFTFFERR